MKRKRLLELFGYGFVANDWSRMIHSAKHSTKRCDVFNMKNGRYVTKSEALILIAEQEYVACICTKNDGLYIPAIAAKSAEKKDGILRMMDGGEGVVDDKPRTGGGTHL